MDYAAGTVVAIATIAKWAVVAILCFLAAFRLLGALFEREVASLEALVLLAAVLGFAGLAIRLSDTIWFFVLLLGMLGVFVVVQYFPYWLVKKDRRKLFLEDLKRYQKGIDFDPNNVAGYSFLADTYMKLGNIDLAIENYRKALALDPALIEAKAKLAKAMQEKIFLQGRSMFCPRCIQPREPKAKICLGCGHFYAATETIAYNLSRQPKQKPLLFLYSGAGLLLFLVFIFIGLPWLTWPLLCLAAWRVYLILHKLSEWN